MTDQGLPAGLLGAIRPEEAQQLNGGERKHERVDPVHVESQRLRRLIKLRTARRIFLPSRKIKGQCKDRGGCSPLRKRPRRRAKQQRALTRKQILIL